MFGRRVVLGNSESGYSPSSRHTTANLPFCALTAPKSSGANTDKSWTACRELCRPSSILEHRLLIKTKLESYENAPI